MSGVWKALKIACPLCGAGKGRYCSEGISVASAGAVCALRYERAGELPLPPVVVEPEREWSPYTTPEQVFS